MSGVEWSFSVGELSELVLRCLSVNLVDAD